MSKELWQHQLLSNEHGLKEQVQHLIVVLIGVCSTKTTQHLSNNALQVGIFLAVREPLVALLETGLTKNHIPFLPVSYPESAALDVFEGLMKRLPFWKCGCLGVFAVAVLESAWNGHGNIISVFRKINAHIKLQHTVAGA